MSYSDKEKVRQHVKEQKAQAFRCGHCRAFVVMHAYMGTKNRNHCNFCLWSKHVDEEKGDRNSNCQGGMKPVGLTFKHEGFSEWGEIMLIHVCKGCSKISINRIAGDDDVYTILDIFTCSQSLNESMKLQLQNEKITLLTEEDREEIKVQLFGKVI